MTGCSAAGPLVPPRVRQGRAVGHTPDDPVSQLNTMSLSRKLTEMIGSAVHVPCMWYGPGDVAAASPCLGGGPGPCAEVQGVGRPACACSRSWTGSPPGGVVCIAAGHQPPAGRSPTLPGLGPWRHFWAGSARRWASTRGCITARHRGGTMATSTIVGSAGRAGRVSALRGSRAPRIPAAPARRAHPAGSLGDPCTTLSSW
mmetsp:Transcript_158/g.461  ORF Transcript_158/g.461 Transcript_158/m.461 type:complete len:201 (-) Transcript_158:1165-1767(-)